MVAIPSKSPCRTMALAWLPCLGIALPLSSLPHHRNMHFSNNWISKLQTNWLNSYSLFAVVCKYCLPCPCLGWSRIHLPTGTRGTCLSVGFIALYVIYALVAIGGRHINSTLRAREVISWVETHAHAAVRLFSILWFVIKVTAFMANEKFTQIQTARKEKHGVCWHSLTGR